MGKALIIYHSADPDGWCSAALMHAIVTEQWAGHGDDYVKLDGYNYDHFPEIDDDVTEVYMGDVSPPPETMQTIVDKVGLESIFWWDHHMGRIKEIYGKSNDFAAIKGLRQEGIAGAKLILDWMEHNRADLHKKYSATNVVEFVHLYDTWKHEYREDVLEQNAGLRIHPKANPKSGEFVDFWKLIMSGDDFISLKVLSDTGKVAYQTQRTIWDADCWSGKTCVLRGGVYDAPSYFVLNTSNDPSLMFSKKIREEHDCCIAWYYHQKKGKYKISCRSTDGKSAQEIAINFGGGGHPDAAGAWIDKGDWAKFESNFGMTP